MVSLSRARSTRRALRSQHARLAGARLSNVEGLTMPQEIDAHRRRFFGIAAMNIAAAQLGTASFAQAQSAEIKKAQLPGIKPGTNTAFARLRQIDAGILNIGSPEAGPAAGPAVILL